MSETRIEHDSMGDVEVSADALYGAQTQRAINNFTISNRILNARFIKAVITIKKAAAISNLHLGMLEPQQANAIETGCDTLLQSFPADQFPISIFQTGSGTSTNMNVNEVLANLAQKSGVQVHPNDHVNLGQSSNDVIPSALLISSALAITGSLLPAIDKLVIAIKEKASEYNDVVKTGRTHLMDALPIKVSAEFKTWAIQLEECKERFNDLLPRLCRLPLGGTAVGSGVNCHHDFPEKAIQTITALTGVTFTSSPLKYKGMSSLDTPLEASAHFKTLATVLIKISNDLRWMNSGPLAGIGEITLPPLQPGSSIMPAKVNPVIPEAVCMASAQVTGLDAANTVAAQSGTFQLNTMFPLVAENLLESASLLAGSCQSLTEKVFNKLVVNRKHCQESLARNPILVTALAPEIGYERAAEIGKIALKQHRTVLDIALESTDIPKEKLEALLNPTNLAEDGS